MTQRIDSLNLGKTPTSTVFKLALPAIVEQLMLTMVQYVDTAMVGSLGNNATAAIGVCSSTIWFFNGLLAAVAVGFSVLVARLYGAAKPEEARRVVMQSALVCVGLGLLVTAVMTGLSFGLPIWMGADPAIVSDSSAYFRIIGYAAPLLLASNIYSSILRSTGDTRTPMLFNIAINVLNVILNYFLIFPTRQLTVFGTEITVWRAGLGVRGAAIASAIATGVVGAAFFAVVTLRKSPIRFSPFERICPDGTILRDAFRLGMPVFLERATMSAGQIVMTYLITGLGSVAVSANHLAVSAESISYMPASGFAVAVTVLVGQALGAGDEKAAVRFGKITLIMGFFSLLASGVLLYVFSDGLISLFIQDAAVISLGGQMLRIVAFAEPLFATSIILIGVFRGSGDTRFGFYVGMICMWGVRIVSALFLVPRFGLAGAWYAMVADLCLRGIICLVYFTSKKWLRAFRFGVN